MIMYFLARQCFVTFQGGIQNRFVVLDIHRNEIKIAVCNHQLLAKPSVDFVMYGLQRFRPAGRDQSLVELQLCIKPDIHQR